MVFGNTDPESRDVEMIRCITAFQLWEQNGTTTLRGVVHHRTNGWWLLVPCLDETSPVSSGTSLICLELSGTPVEI